MEAAFKYPQDCAPALPFGGVRADHCFLDTALLAATDAAAACMGAVPTGVGGTNGSWALLLGPTLGLTFSCPFSACCAVCFCIAAATCCTSICRYATASQQYAQNTGGKCYHYTASSYATNSLGEDL